VPVGLITESLQSQSSQTYRRNTREMISMDTNDVLFEYQPLDLERTSIRLVEILDDGPEGEIACETQHVIIDKCHVDSVTTIASYACLSYVWGPLDEVRSIKVNGKPFEILRNLWNVLSVLSPLKACGLASLIHREVPNLDLVRCTRRQWVDVL
jgi:hypothetical protein